MKSGMINTFTNIGDQQEATAPPFLPPPPPYEAHQYSASQPKSKDDMLHDIISRHEISSFFAGKLQKLKTFKIVFIFDDSGSMNTTLDESPLNTTTFKVSLFLMQTFSLRKI